MSLMLFGTFGLPEIAVIVGLCVIIFGAKRLPQLGAGLGQGIRNFKTSLGGGDSKPAEETEKKDDP